MHIFNYIIRAITIIAGILLLIGVLAPDMADPALPRVLGGVLILFGIYRLLLYNSQRKKESADEE